MSSPENHKELKNLLKKVIAPAQETELQRDLWPQMLRKLKDESAQAVSVPWFDWVLAGILSAVLFLFPGAIPALLYNL
jgi:hypothetical protein